MGPRFRVGRQGERRELSPKARRWRTELPYGDLVPIAGRSSTVKINRFGRGRSPRKWLVILMLSLMLPLSLPLGASAVDAFPLTETDVDGIKKALADRFSGEDVDRLVDYFRDAIAGQQIAFPSELKHRLLGAITDLRLEHGFQMTVLLAQLKKAAQHVRNEELDDILKQLERLLVE
jgi:hypothetical protein